MLELEEETPNWKDTTVYVAGFLDGAMWADAHPHWISVLKKKENKLKHIRFKQYHFTDNPLQKLIPTICFSFADSVSVKDHKVILGKELTIGISWLYHDWCVGFFIEDKNNKKTRL